MKLTVLGSSSALFNTKLDYRFPSAYLLETDYSKILLDCGLGVLPQITKLKLQIEDINTICITHFHADHFTLQPIMLEYFLAAKNRAVHPKLQILGPSGIEERTKTWFDQSGLDYDRDLMPNVDVRFIELANGQAINIDDITLIPHKVEHYDLDAYAFRVEQGGKTLTYSGDSMNCDALSQAARGADLFLCEASIANDKLSDTGHLNAHDAAMTAKKAGAKHLVLTHYTGIDPIDLMADAARRTGFSGEISVAGDLDIYEL